MTIVFEVLEPTITYHWLAFQSIWWHQPDNTSCYSSIDRRLWGHRCLLEVCLSRAQVDSLYWAHQNFQLLALHSSQVTAFNAKWEYQLEGIVGWSAHQVLASWCILHCSLRVVDGLVGFAVKGESENKVNCVPMLHWYAKASFRTLIFRVHGSQLGNCSHYLIEKLSDRFLATSLSVLSERLDDLDASSFKEVGANRCQYADSPCIHSPTHSAEWHAHDKTVSTLSTQLSDVTKSTKKITTIRGPCSRGWC